jgi:NAD(P)-dependent dehydrogenase (short-subunit alcohol dehydrogenase family)
MQSNLDLRFDNQTVIITGASRGIGQATAELFAQQGAAVVLVDRLAVLGEAVAAEIIAQGGRASFVAADVTQPAQVEMAVAHALATYGRIDVLVNNAGINPSGLFWEMPLSMWQEVIAINLTGPLLLARAVAPHLFGYGGAIINVASVLGQATLPGQSAYSASKAGLIGLTKAMALDLADKGVRVNCILPGSTDTPLMWGYRDKAQVTAEEQQLAAASVPLGRVAPSHEVASAILLLASPAASLITGAVLAVDGGLLAKIAAAF